jgi:ribosome-binding protein aMBF1 (putative translation factor)
MPTPTPSNSPAKPETSLISATQAGIRGQGRGRGTQEKERREVMSFRKKLRTIRRDKGMSRRELANASGLEAGKIRGIEDGRRTFSFKSAVKLAGALGISCDELATGIAKGKTKRGPQRRAAAAP